MENPNINTTEPTGKPQQELKPKEVNIKEGGDSQEVLFFNVMPKNSQTGEFTDPKIVSVTTPSAANSENSFMNKIKANKLYVIMGAVVLIGAPLIYFLFIQFGGGSYESEDLLTPVTSKPKPTPADSENLTTSQEWRDKYFPKCTESSICGDDADPDHDGLSNSQEFKINTDPNNADSDQDGISDGDEINVFGSDPLQSHTAKNDKFSDLDYIKGGFSFTTDKKMTEEEISSINIKMQSLGLHQPTITSIGEYLNSLYKFNPSSSTTTPELSPSPTPTSTSTPLDGFDLSLSAKQDRDTKRSNTIKNIEIALVKYYADNKRYPDAQTFNEMFGVIKPYLKVATNSKDPVDKEPYVYSYVPNTKDNDFTLTFYSEVAGGPISKHAEDAQKEAASQNAEVYDNQRKMDMEDLRTALLLYSNNNIAGNQTYVFPTLDKYKTALVPEYLSAIPKDPGTGKDYEYTPSANFDAFTLKVTLQSPPAGNTGYICNQIDECKYY